MRYSSLKVEKMSIGLTFMQLLFALNRALKPPLDNPETALPLIQYRRSLNQRDMNNSAAAD